MELKEVEKLAEEKCVEKTLSTYQSINYKEGFMDGYSAGESNKQDVAVKFAEWINKNFYVRYWGSDEPNNGKWYHRGKSLPDRTFFTTSELFSIAEKEGYFKEIK